MNSDQLNAEIKDLETRLERASILHHRCLGTVVERWLIKDPHYSDVSAHCLDQKRRVDALYKELNSNYL